MHFSAFIVVVIITLSHIGKYGMLPTLLCSLLTAVTCTSQQLENMYLACATCENGVKHLMLFGNHQIIYGLAETGNPLNPHLTVCKLLNDLIMLGNLCKNSKIIFSFKSKQGFIQDVKLGGGNPCFVEARQTRGVWGHAPPENF